MSISNDDLQKMFDELLVDGEPKGTEQSVLIAPPQSASKANCETLNESNLRSAPPSYAPSAITAKLNVRPSLSVKPPTAMKNGFGRGSANSGSVFTSILRKYEPESVPVTQLSNVVQTKQSDSDNVDQLAVVDAESRKLAESEAQISSLTVKPTVTARLFKVRILSQPPSRLAEFVTAFQQSAFPSRFHLRKWRVRESTAQSNVIELNTSAKKRPTLKRFDFASPSQDDRWLIQQKRLKPAA